MKLFIFSLVFIANLGVFAQSNCVASAIENKISTVCSKLSSYSHADLQKKQYEIAQQALVFENCGLSQIILTEPVEPYRILLAPLRPWSNLTADYSTFVDDFGALPIFEFAKNSQINKTTEALGNFSIGRVRFERKIIGTQCELLDKTKVLAFGSIIQSAENNFYQPHLLEMDYLMWEKIILPGLTASTSLVENTAQKKNEELKDVFAKMISVNTPKVSKFLNLSNDFVRWALKNKLNSELGNTAYSEQSKALTFLKIYDKLHGEFLFLPSLQRIQSAGGPQQPQTGLAEIQQNFLKLEKNLTELNEQKTIQDKADKKINFFKKQSDLIALAIALIGLALSIFNLIKPNKK